MVSCEVQSLINQVLNDEIKKKNINFFLKKYHYLTEFFDRVEILGKMKFIQIYSVFKTEMRYINYFKCNKSNLKKSIGLAENE